MRSLRVGDQLDEKLCRAAAMSGESVSQFIRTAAEDRADELLAGQPGGPFADVAGVVHGGGGRARQSGRAFATGIAKERSAR